MAQHIASKEQFQAAFGVSRETVERLDAFVGLVRQWQKAVNLVAPSTLDQIWSRHIADSAELIRLAPGARRWLDLGSGGGFPGLVVAIMGAETGLEHMTLIESDMRKSAFLRDVVRVVGLRNVVDIIVERIENPANTLKVGEVDVISARALAPLVKLLGLAEPYFGAKTVGVFPKGRDLASEVEAARQVWTFAFSQAPSATSADAGIALIRELRRKAKG